MDNQKILEYIDFIDSYIKVNNYDIEEIKYHLDRIDNRKTKINELLKSIENECNN